MPSSTVDSPLYLDACVLLAYVKGEAGRVENIEPLFRAAQKGDLELVTSMVSVVEVAAGVSQILGKRSPAIEAKIDGLWDGNGPIKLVELYRYVADDARDLLRQAVDLSRKLTPLDAVHLATARRMKSSRLLTYDNALPKWGTDAGLAIATPAPAAEMFPTT